ncbi:hypothetical protein HMPREF9012_0170 [Bacteroidetes bacterium oral taxon 272 str. F0290]|nr:hypothetical protein HMPREF9012_0170 [Bacteroidetes bacterium oral taxon 272 str. F0290]
MKQYIEYINSAIVASLMLKDVLNTGIFVYIVVILTVMPSMLALITLYKL